MVQQTNTPTQWKQADFIEKRKGGKQRIKELLEPHSTEKALRPLHL